MTRALRPGPQNTSVPGLALPGMLIPGYHAVATVRTTGEAAQTGGRAQEQSPTITAVADQQ